MEVATYILFVLGCLGATDILLYHSISHGIRTHKDSQGELWLHGLRGPIYAALFVLIPNFAMHGAFFWVLVGILVLDVGVSLGDFALERHSREFFGGLPTGEYILHIILAMLFGALVTSIFNEGGQWRDLPTQIEYKPAAVPLALRGLLGIMAVLVLGSGILDGLAALRLRNEQTS